MESSPFYFHLSRDLLYTTDWSTLNSFIRLCLVEQNIRVGKLKQETPLRQRRQAMSGLLLFNYRRGMMMGKKKGCVFLHFSFCFISHGLWTNVYWLDCLQLLALLLALLGPGSAEETTTTAYPVTSESTTTQGTVKIEKSHIREKEK